MPKAHKKDLPSLKTLMSLFLWALVYLLLFYFVFIDLRVYVFLYDLFSRVTQNGLILYPVSFLIGWWVVWLFYYNRTCPLIEDFLSYGIMNKFIVKRLEDPRSHELVHLSIFVYLLMPRLMSFLLGTNFALGIYLVLWGGALVSFILRVISFRPYSRNDAKYFEAKTRFLRTKKESPHSISLRKTGAFMFCGELLLYTLYFISRSVSP